MSGGSLEYIYARILDAVDEIEKRKKGRTDFENLTIALMKDVAAIVHDLEWWYSCDYGEGQFIRTCILHAGSLKEIARDWNGEAQSILDFASKIVGKKEERE